jgi:hypothetical protein
VEVISCSPFENEVFQLTRVLKQHDQVNEKRKPKLALIQETGCYSPNLHYDDDDEYKVRRREGKGKEDLIVLT